MEKIRVFFHDIRKEIEKIKWPTKKNMIKYSTAVLVFCFFFGIFFYVMNIIMVLIKGVLK